MDSGEFADVLRATLEERAELRRAGQSVPSLARRFPSEDISAAHARGDYQWLATAMENHFRRETQHWWTCDTCAVEDGSKWFCERRKRCSEGQALDDEWIELSKDAIAQEHRQPFTLRLLWPDGSIREVEIKRGVWPN